MTMSKPSVLQPVKRVPLYEVLVDRLRKHIQQAKLKEGDRLPAERQLAADLAVSRASVRQALVALEVQGLIEIRHGGGSYLRRTTLDPASFAEIISRRSRLPDILDTREALEVKLAELAAERRTDADLEAIQLALDKMARSIDAGGRGSEGDAAFHAAVTVAAHAPIMGHLMETLAAEIRESRRESLTQKGRPAESLKQHRAIATAIKSAQPTRASAAMRRHLRNVRNVKLLRWKPPESAV